METFTTILLWLVGLVFLGAAGSKLLVSPDRLASNANMPWVEREGVPKARLAGATELAASVVLLLTALGVLDIPVLAALAAFGLATQMAIAAFSVHQPAGEPTVPPLVLSATSLLLAVLLVV